MADLVATRDAYGKALAELGRENPNVVVLDADLSKSTKTNVFAKEFPERFFQMGIAESNMMGTAAGLATCGKIPFVSTFAIFATGRAWEQVRLVAGYTGLGVKVAATHAGITVGEDGASHQATEDIALMRVIPGMTVLVPADATEARLMVRAAAETPGPVYLRLGREPVPVIFDESYRVQVGRAVTLREGGDVAILACGIMAGYSLTAAEMLAEQGIAARVVNVSTIKPLDEQAIVAAAEACGGVVTAEEHTVIGGLGSAVAETLGRNRPTPIEMVGLQDRFGQSGKPAQLLEEYGLTPRHIAEAAKRVMKRK